MKRGGPSHPKTLYLASLLSIPRAHAVGLTECLFHWAGGYARRGDIGKYSNATIADGCGWISDPDVFVQALLESRWVDRCECHKLRIHDWPEHADNAVRKTSEVKAAGFLECYSASDPKKPPNPQPVSLDRHKAQGTGHRAPDSVENLNPEDPESVSRFYLGCFNACFSRRCTMTMGIRERVTARMRIQNPDGSKAWHSWQIVAQPLLVYANTRDEAFRSQIMPEWPLRDGKRPRTDRQGFTNGATDWLEREYNRADRTVLDARLKSIAETFGVMSRLVEIGVNGGSQMRMEA